MSVLNKVIASIDGESRRIFLKEGVSDFYPIEDLYHEYRTLRRLNIDDIRNYNAILRAEGNISKGGGAYTPRYVILLEDAKIVPFDEILQVNQLGDMITDDADNDPFLYDTSTITVPKVIYIKPSESETIQLNSVAIEYASYDNGATIDVINGVEGTEYPIGTAFTPSNNVADAVAIANFLGFTKLHIIGDLILTNEDDVSTFDIVGQSTRNTHITLAGNVDNTKIINATVNGVAGNKVTFDECSIESISNMNGIFTDCGFTEATVYLIGGKQTSFINCFSDVSGSSTPHIDVGGSGQSVAVRDWSGGLEIHNRTGNDPFSMDFDSGHAKINSSCTGAPITIRGGYKLTVGVGATIPDNIGSFMMDDSDIISGIDAPTALEIAYEVWTTNLPLTATINVEHLGELVTYLGEQVVYTEA